MFVPGIGAFVRSEQLPGGLRARTRASASPARSGASAPSLATAALALATGSALLGAIARFSAWLNLFNLLPILSLDGGRGFRSLSRTERWIAAAACGAIWWATHEMLLAALALVAAFRAAFTEAPAEGDREGLVRYIGLAVVLETLAQFMHATFPH